MNKLIEIVGTATVASLIFISGFASGRNYSKRKITSSGDLVINERVSEESSLFLKLELDIDSLKKMDAVIFRVVKLNR